MTIDYRRTKALVYPCCCKASRAMSSMVCWWLLISVSKDVSNWVTGNEVSDMTLFSAVRCLVRRFSQFCKTQTRQRVTIAINNNPICKIHVMVTCKNNMICKCTWQILRCTSRCLLQILQYGRSRQRAHSPSVGLRTPQFVHEAPIQYHKRWICITIHNHVRSCDTLNY